MARAAACMTPRAARDTHGDQRRSDPINVSTVDIPDSDRIRSRAITTLLIYNHPISTEWSLPKNHWKAWIQTREAAMT